MTPPHTVRGLPLLLSFSVVPLCHTYFNSSKHHFSHYQLNIHVQNPSWSFHSSIPFFLPYLSTHLSYRHLPSMPLYTSHFPHLSCVISHLAHTSHSGQDALVVALPRHLAEEKVYLIVVWIVGVRNGMSSYKPGLWRHGVEKRERGEC